MPVGLSLPYEVYDTIIQELVQIGKSLKGVNDYFI